MSMCHCQAFVLIALLCVPFFLLALFFENDEQFEHRQRQERGSSRAEQRADQESEDTDPQEETVGLVGFDVRGLEVFAWLWQVG